MASTRDYDRVASEQRRPGKEGAGGGLDMTELVRLATLAASSHNTQPWKFRIRGRSVTLFPDFARRCPVVDPDDSHLFKSLGCAAENLIHAVSPKTFARLLRRYSVVESRTPRWSGRPLNANVKSHEKTRRSLAQMFEEVMSDSAIEGGCLCRAVRYRITSDPLAKGRCHCRTCRLASGAPSVAWAVFRSSDFAFIAEQPASFQSSPGVVRTFCRNCGTPLTYQRTSKTDTIDVTTATLDSPNDFAPTKEVWVEDKLAWERLNEAIEHYPKSSTGGASATT